MAEGERPWRLFVAVPIGPELRAAIEGCVSVLRSRPGADAWRWTDAEGWHVTLAFLGATDAGEVARLTTALERAVVEHEPFELDAGGVGAFPSRRRARVLWYGIADPAGELRRLARSVRAAVEPEVDERFRGHLTLARARDRSGTDATALTSAVDCAASPRLAVDRVVLYRSHLARGPARYEQLTAARLGRSAA